MSWIKSHIATAALFALISLAATAEDVTSSPPAVADKASSQQPLWEVGIAGAGGAVPEYPASDQYNLRAVPYPFFIYRGTFLRSDENGTRVRATWTSNIELDVSGSASFAAHSESSGARTGMPDLDDLFELGPNLKITLARPAPGLRVLAELPVREVTSIDGLNFAYRGLVFAPGIGPQARSLFGSPWAGYAQIGVAFANQRLQDYYYGVASQYATAARPAYDAHGGYMGSRIEFGLSRPIGKSFRVFVYNRLGYYGGAENADSPLFKANIDYLAFAGIDWSVFRSHEQVNGAETQ